MFLGCELCSFRYVVGVFLTTAWIVGNLGLLAAVVWHLPLRMPRIFRSGCRATQEVMRLLVLTGTPAPRGVCLLVRGRRATVEARGARFVLRIPASPCPEELDTIRRVLRTRGVDNLRIDGEHLVVTTPSLAAGIGATSEAERLLYIIERVVALTPDIEDVLSVRPLEIERTRCPYCHDELTRGETHAFCTKCGSAHHVECYADHGRCAIFGCGGSGQRAAASPTRAHSRASLSAATLIGSSSPEARIAR